MSRRPWRRASVRSGVAVLVGLVAVAAAVLGTMEAATSKEQERASLLAARLATQVFEGTAATSQVDSFGLNAQQDVILTQLSLTAHALAALQNGQDATILSAEEPVEQAAADRMAAVIGGMTDRARLGSVGDAHTAHVLALGDAGLVDLVTAQGAALDRANRFGSQSTVIVYALSLAALAGVLAGLAGVLRRGPPAIACLLAGYGVLIGGAILGAAAVLG